MTPASGCQDHTPLPSASHAVRYRRIRVHRIPPRGRDDRVSPLQRGRDSGRYRPDLGFGKTEIFFPKGVDTASEQVDRPDLPVGQITRHPSLRGALATKQSIEPQKERMRRLRKLVCDAGHPRSQQHHARKDGDGRVTRLRRGFAGSSLLVRRSLSEGGSPAMTENDSFSSCQARLDNAGCFFGRAPRMKR